MEISLEKIELVKDRTGVSYKEAKEALEKTEGNVVDAIILIEDSIDGESNETDSKVTELVGKIKEIVKSGNVSRIIVKKDDAIILNLPVNIGVIGTVVFPDAKYKFFLTASADERARRRTEELLAKGGLDSLTEYYAKKWSGMLLDYLSNGKDALFFNAPLIALFVSPHSVNAAIAATQMNLMAESLELGACFIGFAKRAVEYDPGLKKVLGMKDDERLVCALAIGKPRVKFLRAPGRKKLDVTRL